MSYQPRDVISISEGRQERAERSARRRFGKRSHFEMALLLDDLCGESCCLQTSWGNMAKRHGSDVATVRKIIFEMEQRGRLSVSPNTRLPESNRLFLVLHERADRSRQVESGELSIGWYGLSRNLAAMM